MASARPRPHAKSRRPHAKSWRHPSSPSPPRQNRPIPGPFPRTTASARADLNSAVGSSVRVHGRVSASDDDGDAAREGSGFAVSTEGLDVGARGAGDLIATSAHLIADMAEPLIDLADGRRRLPGRLLACDTAGDLAVLSVAGAGLETAAPENRRDARGSGGRPARLGARGRIAACSSAFAVPHQQARQDPHRQRRRLRAGGAQVLAAGRSNRVGILGGRPHHRHFGAARSGRRGLGALQTRRRRRRGLRHPS